MTKEPTSSKPARELPYRELTGSQYRAIADRVKAWNPDLWDQWAQLGRELRSWSDQEAADRQNEYKERSKQIGFKIMDFLIENGMAKKPYRSNVLVGLS